jgi:hypothetical protein
MAAATHDADLQQLTQMVANLAEAVARSERRHAHLTRALRWGTFALVTLVAAAVALTEARHGSAYAAVGGDACERAAAAAESISQSLGMFASMGQAMAESTLSGPGMKDQVDAYLQHRQIPVNLQNELAYVFPVALHASPAIQNGAKLIARLGEDSDAWHNFIVNPSPALNGIQQELGIMNGALHSVPAMVVQMDFMNRNMASMSHSMGSTMGRMGSWMP